jgi:hypothetical protein
MKVFPEILFWCGIAAIPLAWLIWYFGPEIEIVRPILSDVTDPVMRAALKEAHGERLGIFVSIWPVTLLVLSQILEKRWR